MKKICVALILVLLCMSMVLPVMAEASVRHFVDSAELMGPMLSEHTDNKLNTLSEQYGLDIVVVTTNTLDGKTPMAYADDYYDYNGYREDGVLLLVSMEDNDWWISTTGYGITVFTDAGIEYIGNKVVPYISDGNYAKAFEVFADTCEEFICQAKTGDPYDTHNLPKAPFKFLKNLVICIGIGFVIALIATGIMKGQLKTVRAKAGASDYVKRGSMNVTHRQDLFLYRDVKRTAKPKSSSGSSTHTSSSGRSHGGGGGKF